MILLLIPISFGIAVVTQNIQTVLFVASVLYLIVAGAYLVFVSDGSKRSDRGLITSGDFVLRRGGAWGLIAFILFISLLITQRFLAGTATSIIVYAGGVLDQASVQKSS